MNKEKLISLYSIPELNERLVIALKEEDYESAIEMRDELSKRKQELTDSKC